MSTKFLAISALSALLMTLGGAAQAQDAMAADPMMDSMGGDSMMATMSEEDLATCIAQAKAITFADVAMVAEKACQDLHTGHGAMGGDAMGSDSMMSAQ
ncbi:MAG: hypothetical protein ABS75_30030 [Pelagibacterium sp. SCN 63-23]|nr:MAG: hypothetical protein ABS75_30030 [Pelagibacterium sp. SCN 63-23]